ncbi:MAG: NUDIX hydrolase [Candidatus Doudnabacteria bacterium]|nr:NUDIX hydrolase [Candidatus Doudnabacteria bacterium]
MTYKKANKLHIVAVTAVIQNEEGNVLVLKRSEREIAMPGLYTFPGGKVEDNQSIEEALAEEIKEETGLEMLPGKLLLKDVAFVRPDGQTVKVFAYLCRVASTEHVRYSEDFSDARWISYEDLEHIEHVGIEGELEQIKKLQAAGMPLENLMTTSVRKEPEPVS